MVEKLKGKNSNIWVVIQNRFPDRRKVRNLIKQGRWLKASTLVEVLVALVIGLAAFSIGMVIYMNVVKSASVETRVDTRLHLNKLVNEFKKGEITSENIAKYNGLSIELTVFPYNELEDVSHLRAIARRSDSSIVASVNELIRTKVLDEGEEEL